MVPTVFRDTGPHLWHTCPTRHVKVHSSRDTCESTCTGKRHNEFERQPTFLRRSGGPSEDALHSSVTNAADFRVLQTSHSLLKIGGKTFFLSITVKKCTVVVWQRRLQASVDLTSRHGGFFELLESPWCFWGRNSTMWVRSRKNVKISVNRLESVNPNHLDIRISYSFEKSKSYSFSQITASFRFNFF
jgi:hypothetical protein